MMPVRLEPVKFLEKLNYSIRYAYICMLGNFSCFYCLAKVISRSGECQ